jgi:zona occludens toxin
MAGRFVGGLPGNAKTLFVLDNLAKWYPRRPVFYRKIDGVLTEWFKNARGVQLRELTDAELLEWFKFPPGSVFLIDEAHKDFPQRTEGKPPVYVQEFAEHRHYGHDFVFISQNEMDMDIFIRRRCQPVHLLKRVWGFERSTVLTFQEYPRDGKYRPSLAQKSTYKFSKELYGKYKSAETHTIKGSVPKVMYVYGVVAVGIASSIVWLASSIGSAPVQKDNKLVDGNAVAKVGPVDLSPEAWASAERKKWVIRDDRFPASAPVYDKVRRPPLSYPKVVGCVGSPSLSPSCRCWNQQGRDMRLSSEVCAYYLARVFDSELPDVALEHNRSGVVSGSSVSGSPPVGIGNPLGGLLGSAIPSVTGVVQKP